MHGNGLLAVLCFALSTRPREGVTDVSVYAETHAVQLENAVWT